MNKTKQKNFRLNEITIMRIEGLAKDYDLKESRIIELASIMMDTIMYDGGNIKGWEDLTVKDIRKMYIEKIKVIHGEK